MADYDHELRFGSFLTPAQRDPQAVVGLAQLCEELALDLVSFSDHPYQPAHLDTWTLMSFVAAATTQIRIVPNVLNLPLRPPAVLARAAVSLDLLSGGRLELGLGAGGVFDAIEAMGGPRRTPGESVVALEEAVAVLRQLWDANARGGARLEGEHYQLRGAKRGPAAAHDIEIWLGGYKPRMLRLTGRVANGWLPSQAYLPPAGLPAANAVIDEAAVAAGRAPGDIRRLYNLSGRFTAGGDGFLQGPAEQWVDDLTELTVRDGISTFILASDDPVTLTTYATEVAPAVRAAVAAARGSGQPPTPPTPQAGGSSTLRRPREAEDDASAFAVRATPDDGKRLVGDLWDPTTRPMRPAAPSGQHYPARNLAGAQQLVAIHDHLRKELMQIQGLVSQVLEGTSTAGEARTSINELTIRQNNWTVGAYCTSYCRLVTAHHSIEDQAMFPRLRREDPTLAPVVQRLQFEHEVIHGVLDAVDRALVSFVGLDADGPGLRRAVDQLSDTLLSHLSYEERELLEPIARLGVLV
ncbi:MAG TPA: LLM class flavin-dependent oxidoreductase [Propionibacteriaceae bacterium]|nr:LLM class flavin-dependent oxidoreductase [Propionibacteriaceae bacterium]